MSFHHQGRPARRIDAVYRTDTRTGGVEPYISDVSVTSDASGGRPLVSAWGTGGKAAPTVSEVIDALRRTGRKRKALPAALVEFMEGRKSAAVEEVAQRVHGFGGVDCERIYANVRRTIERLEALAADFRFRFSAGYVHKMAAGVMGDELPINSQCRQSVDNP